MLAGMKCVFYFVHNFKVLSFSLGLDFSWFVNETCHVVKFRGQSQDDEAKTSVSPMKSHEEARKLHKHAPFNLYYCLILWLHADGSFVAESIMFSLHTNLSIEIILQVHLTGIVHKELSFRASKSWAVSTTGLKSTLSHCLHFVFTSCSALYCASFLSFILQR